MKKAIILVVILIAIGGAALYFKNYKVPDNQAQSSSTPPVTKYDETTIPKVVNDFYQNYESCLKNPPAVAAGRVSEYCQSNTGLTTSAFAGNLAKGGIAAKGADPIFCAQSVPESKIVSAEFQVKNGQATGFMDEKFGPNQIKVQVELVSEKGVWKVDNVICPAIPSQGGNGILPYDSGVSGTVSIGPTCPVVKNPPDPACADKPYKTIVQVIAINSPKSSPFATAETDAEGRYKIMLPPGEYGLQPIGGNPLPRCETKNITIEPKMIKEMNLSCDSGIR